LGTQCTIAAPFDEKKLIIAHRSHSIICVVFCIHLSQRRLNRVLLLDSLARRYFHIESVTFGDQTWMYVQTVADHCQQWTNTDHLSLESTGDKVCCIKVMLGLVLTVIYVIFVHSLKRHTDAIAATPVIPPSSSTNIPSFIAFLSLHYRYIQHVQLVI